jgi:hypothetical protein
MPTKFLDHGKFVDRLLYRVVQHMEPDEASVEAAVIRVR